MNLSPTINDIMNYIYTAIPLDDEQYISEDLMDDIAEEFHGEVWNSGGNIMLCTIPLSEDSQIVIGEDSIVVYMRPLFTSQEAFKYLHDDFPNTTVWYAS